MDRVQTFTTPKGEEMVIIPRAEYDRLVSNEGEDSDVKVARKVLRRVEAGIEPTVPLEVYKMVRLQGMSRIRAWRIYRDLSTEALARKIKKSHSYIVQLENGTRQGTFETMSLLADCLGTTLDGLRD